MKSFAPLVLSVVLVAGCASKVWYQPGKTEVQIRQDWAEAQLAARLAQLGTAPPLLLSDNDFAAGLAWRAQHDTARAARALAPLTMQARGYQLVPLSTVPTNAAYLKP